MTYRVVICDDSGFARKQLARALPEHLAADVAFAAHGGEALDILKTKDADLLFLDLNMPEVDGYQTLAAMRKNDISVKTIVVSGDIQPEARARVMELGAIEFIKKPIGKDELADVLSRLGLTPDDTGGRTVMAETVTETIEHSLSLPEVLQEIANVAMGQAADMLARLLDVFVELPVPRVSELGYGDLLMLLADANRSENVSAVCQGFIGFGIAGESLLLFNDSSLKDISRLMQFEDNPEGDNEAELLMDMANILIGASLAGIARQLDVQFSQGHPLVLGRHVNIGDLLDHKPSWKTTLAIEIPFKIEGRSINADLLIFFTEDSLPHLETRATYLSEA
jgi:chemotaxis protein CheY-P-specific phosphatase CheC